MRKIIFLAVFCLILSAISFAQVPQKMSYQAVVRGSDNNLVTNQQVAMRVSILQGSVDGTAVYTETHSATTNANGLLTIEIGDGTSNDDFTAINWANGPFFVKTETDVNGGDDYDIIGVSQLLSVPYAMYAQTAGNMPDVSGFLTEETDPTIPDWAKANAKPTYSYDEITGKPELFSGNYNDLTNKPTIPTVPTLVSAFTNDANYLQSESDPTIPDWAKANAKPTYSYDEITGKPELFSGNYNDLTNKPTIPTVPTNVSAFTNDANYVINETDPTVPDWAKANAKPTYSYDEITGKPELFSGNYNDLTNKPTIPTVPTLVSAFTNDANYLQSESDPTIPDWAKANAKPTYSYDEITGKPELFSGNYNDLTNKPTIPTVPTLVSAFTNDANYISSETQTLADVAALGNSLNTQLKNVTDPTDAQDAVTKAYVDELVAQLQSALAALISEPAVITSAATGITANHVTLSGNVAINGNATVTARGFVYGTSENDLSENVQSGSGMGIFTHTLTNLSAVTTYYYRAYATNNAGTAFGELMSFTTLATTGTLSGHDWVDLGLPSGTRWATCNVGASAPSAYGNYYAWGETTTKTTYDWSTYRYCNGSDNTFTKYCNDSRFGNNGFTDALTTLEATDDAATANWGSGWRMPTRTEMQELIDNCTVTWTIQNGVEGCLFTGPNGASIFLPAAGYRSGSGLYQAGIDGIYWSSSLDTGNPYCAWYLNFYSGNYYVRCFSRNYGQSVRPVCVSAQN